MATELTLLGEEAATALVARTTRRQPGLLVQADTLADALVTVEDLVEELAAGDVEEARASARAVAETLQEWLTSYERMMLAAGRPLPYTRA